VPVIQAYRLERPDAPDAPLNTASPAFRAVNPSGLIPSIDDDGFVLHESLAITLYLACKHGGPLAPRDARETGLVVHVVALGRDALRAARPHRPQRLPASAKDHDPAAAKAAVDALREPFGALDAALRDGGGFAVGGRFTVADVNLAEVSATRSRRRRCSRRTRMCSGGSPPASRGPRSGR
jgi:glutathione S-transferase